jgi:hypothetical protein
LAGFQQKSPNFGQTRKACSGGIHVILGQRTVDGHPIAADWGRHSITVSFITVEVTWQDELIHLVVVPHVYQCGDYL